MRKTINYKYMIGIVWLYGYSMLNYAETSGGQCFSCEDIIANHFQVYKEHIEEKCSSGGISDKSGLKQTVHPKYF